MDSAFEESARSDERPAGLLVVRPGHGEPIASTGPSSIIARSPWSDGHVLIFDQVLNRGAFVSAHHHTQETQGAYIIAGTIGFWVDGEETIAGPGTYVVRPAGSVHALWNAGHTDARMLEITTPAERFQDFILCLQRLRGRQDASADEVVSLAAAFGTFFDEEVSAALTAKLGLDSARVGFTK